MMFTTSRTAPTVALVANLVINAFGAFFGVHTEALVTVFYWCVCRDSRNSLNLTIHKLVMQHRGLFREQ